MSNGYSRYLRDKLGEPLLKNQLKPAWKIGLVPLFLALILTGCAWSPEAKSAKFIETGKKLLQKQDYNRAILQFRNAIRLTPKNAEAYYQLGLAFLGAEDYPDAAVELQRSLQLNPRLTPAQLRLAQLLASTDDPELLKDARERLQKMVAEGPQNADALYALGLTELKLREVADAIPNLQLSLSIAPQAIMVAYSLAEAKLQQGDAVGAEQVLQKACQDAPKSAEAQVILGRFYISQGQFAKAEAQFQRALAIAPKDGGALLNLALVEIQTGNKQGAEQNLKRLSGLIESPYKIAYGIFLFQDGKRDDAVREFQRLLKSDPGDRAARTRLVAAYEAMNRVPDALKLLTTSLQKNPKDLDALLQRGEILLHANDLSKAEVDLNRVLHLKPDSSEVHYAVAKLNQARGGALTYRQELNEVLRLNPLLLQVRIELTKSLILDNAAKAALAMLDAAPAEQKQAIPVLEQRNWALLSLNDLAGAREGIQKGLALSHTPDLLLQDAILKIASQRFAEARASLKEALEKSPEDVRLLRALANSYVAQKQPAAAVKEIQAHAANHANSVEVQYFLGNLLLQNGDQVHAQKAFAEAKALNPGYTPAALELARINLLHADWTSARQQLQEVLSGHGENPLARLWLGMLEVSTGDHQSAEATFRKVLESEPNNPSALNNLAYLLAEKKPDEALGFAQKAKEIQPDDARVTDTLGWILYQKHVYQGAVKYLEMATAKDGTPIRKFHLAMAYLKAGQKERGKTVLNAALRQDPNLPEAKAAEVLFK